MTVTRLVGTRGDPYVARQRLSISATDLAEVAAVADVGDDEPLVIHVLRLGEDLGDARLEDDTTRTHAGDIVSD